MGHEIAREIRRAHEQDMPLVLLLPVCPPEIFTWAVYFLQKQQTTCLHVHCFHTSEWSDKDGSTEDDCGISDICTAMEETFYKPLGPLTVPEKQRHYATQKELSNYPKRIKALRAKGARVVTVYLVGRMMNVAFWEPQFAAEFSSEEEWEAQYYRKGAKLHPITFEQNAVTVYNSWSPRMPCFANTIGPGLFLQSSYAIGGLFGNLSTGTVWQSMSLWTTLRYGKSVWFPSTYMPTLPGKFFFDQALISPLDTPL